MTGIETSEVRADTLKRKREGASNATINRELQEDHVRTGFLEKEDAAKVLPLLPRDLAHVVEFAWITSWRVASEVLTMEWRQIDFGPARYGSTPARRRTSRAASSR